MPLTKATTNVVNLDQDTVINEVRVGKGSGNQTSNTSVGRENMLNNTTGFYNTSVGNACLESNTTGNYNTAVGVTALRQNIGGSNNTAVGMAALRLNTTGNNNTSSGWGALENNTTGTQNTAFGERALQTQTTGSSNTGIGSAALFSSGVAITNSTGLGNNAQVTGSNQVQLGDSATTTYAYGAVQDRSDIRDKADVRDTALGLGFVNALRPVDFRWDMREDYRPEAPQVPDQDASQEEKAAYQTAKAKWLEDVKLANITHNGSKKRNRFHHGLIAQEVKAVLDSKGIDFGGFQDHSVKGGDDVVSIGYVEFIAPLIKAIQELSAKVDILENK